MLRFASAVGHAAFRRLALTIPMYLIADRNAVYVAFRVVSEW